MLLKSWLHIAKSHNIQYALFTGTLLGAIRNNDIIPWDSDIDLLVDMRYYQILKTLSVKRGFGKTDNKIRLVLQPDFMKKVDVDKRRRYSCEGKVSVFLFVLPLYDFLKSFEAVSTKTVLSKHE